MSRAMRHPRRVARVASIAAVIRACGSVHREELPMIALALRCTHRALLCDVLWLKRSGAVRVDGNALSINPLPRYAAAA